MFDFRKALKSIAHSENRLVDGLVYTGAEFSGWAMLRHRLKSRERDGVRLSSYIWADEQDPENKRVKLEILEGTDVEKTSDLIDMIMENLKTSHLLNDGSQHNLQLGDLSLIHPSKIGKGKVLDFLTLADANLGFRFTSIGESTISVMPLAIAMHKYYMQGISPLPFKSSYEMEVGADRTILRVGERVQIRYQRQNAPDSPNFYCLVAAPPVVRLYREDGKVWLESNSPGKVRLVVFNIDPANGRSKGDIKFNVLP